MFGLFHSTAPSFAPRITAIGKAYDYIQRKRGKDTYYGFLFVPDGGKPVNIETEIILPDWGTPAIFNGRTFRIVYLQDSKRSLKNEAIDIEILAGKDTGFHDSLDARPNGAWLWIPIGRRSVASVFSALDTEKMTPSPRRIRRRMTCNPKELISTDETRA